MSNIWSLHDDRTIKKDLHKKRLGSLQGCLWDPVEIENAIHSRITTRKKEKEKSAGIHIFRETLNGSRSTPVPRLCVVSRQNSRWLARRDCCLISRAFRLPSFLSPRLAESRVTGTNMTLGKTRQNNSSLLHFHIINILSFECLIKRMATTLEWAKGFLIVSPEQKKSATTIKFAIFSKRKAESIYCVTLNSATCL